MKLTEKQPLIIKQLSKSILNNRLAHAYLFEGEKGTGKEAVSIWLSQRIYCLADEEQPCGKCLNCQRIENGEHPDVIKIIPDGQTIKVDQIREIKETFSKSGMETGQKVLIIYDAEKMTTSAANSLLKFIEEPDGQIVILFLTSAKARLLPTIQSRCQILHFLPVSIKFIQKELESQGFQPSEAKLLAQLTHSTEKAVEISQEEWFNEAKETSFKWVSYLIEDNPFSFVYVQQKLIKVFKEKEQQILLFDLLLIQLRELLAQVISGQRPTPATKWTQKRLVVSVEEALASRQKMAANVSFQNVCEQLSINLMNG